MAKLKGALPKKIEDILVSEFPPPATVRIEEHDGVYGVITSMKFKRMDSIDRQNWIGEILEKKLNPEERHKILVIVGVTPEEGTGYLASQKAMSKSPKRR